MPNFARSNFEQNLLDMFQGVQCDLAHANSKTDPHYIKLQNDRNSLFRDIQKRLGKSRKLMLKFEYVQNEIDGIDESFVYIQGIRDCVTLLKMIGAL